MFSRQYFNFLGLDLGLCIYCFGPSTSSCTTKTLKCTCHTSMKIGLPFHLRHGLQGHLPLTPWITVRNNPLLLRPNVKASLSLSRSAKRSQSAIFWIVGLRRSNANETVLGQWCSNIFCLTSTCFAFMSLCSLIFIFYCASHYCWMYHLHICMCGLGLCGL